MTEAQGTAAASTRQGARPLQLVPPLSHAGIHDAAIASETPASQFATHRLLQQRLTEVQEEVETLQELLGELPRIFERKFRLRLSRVVEEGRLLEAENRSLASHLKSLDPAAELAVLMHRPHGLLSAGEPEAAARDADPEREAAQAWADPQAAAARGASSAVPG